ncbi:hypothetical protein DFH07DRAFT_1057523 [Mycena maculata]|uniref:F-box domain-containing protein n=1 Tax=Mycena maculata TaxID=230809 RepID=A0AAD7NRA3_9AGAR|nr:hypothetical protein DFH07DRAFT_1057523 [Mycena maculata]
MASPFASRLGTNYCPTDEEVVEIETLLVEPKLQLKRLDDEIADIQKALNRLTEERESFGAYVQAHTALISPVRRLPLDIIQEIFIACLPTHRNCVMSAREAPMLLGRICGSWRAISLATPCLWASLHIVDPGFSRRDDSGWTQSDQRLEVTRAWLRRSGDCPLSISLHSPEFISFDTTNTPAETPLFLQTLIPFASRWQHIQFDIPAEFLESLGQLTANDVPMLKRFALHQVRAHEAVDFAWARLAVFGGSSICRISVSGNSVFPERLPVQWAHLTALSTLGLGDFYISTETVLDVNSPIAAGPMVEHPLLQTLDCRADAFTSHTSHLFDEHYDDQFLIRFLSSLLQLESLHLISDQFPASSLQTILHSLPPTTLQLHLALSSPWHSFFNDDVLAVITPMPGLVTPCPALEVLQIDRCAGISDAALLQLIIARAATLKRIQIDFSRPMQLDIRPQLQSFIQDLDISITHLPPPLPVSPWQGLPDAPPPPPWTPVPLSLT